MSSEIADKVIGIVANVKRIDPAKVTRDSSFEELGLDSLDKINMLFEIENAFNLDVPDEEARAMKSVGQVIDTLETRLTPQPRQSP